MLIAALRQMVKEKANCRRLCCGAIRVGPGSECEGVGAGVGRSKCFIFPLVCWAVEHKHWVKHLLPVSRTQEPFFSAANQNQMFQKLFFSPTNKHSLELSQVTAEDKYNCKPTIQYHYYVLIITLSLSAHKCHCIILLHNKNKNRHTSDRRECKHGAP